MLTRTRTRAPVDDVGVLARAGDDESGVCVGVVDSDDELRRRLDDDFSCLSRLLRRPACAHTVRVCTQCESHVTHPDRAHLAVATSAQRQRSSSSSSSMSTSQRGTRLSVYESM
jgi:hypothetical protein